MEYCILQEKYIITLENKVNDKIKEGYKPFGPLNVIYDVQYGHPRYTQALLKTNPNEFWPHL